MARDRSYSRHHRRGDRNREFHVVLYRRTPEGRTEKAEVVKRIKIDGVHFPVGKWVRA